MKKNAGSPEKNGSAALNGSLLKNNYHYAGAKAVFGPFRASDIAFAVLFIFTAVFFMISMRYGVQSADEAFYFTIPYRLLQGGRLVVDEWHLSQLSAMFQILPLWLFIKITGGTVGLILFFRQLYVLLSLIVFALIYFSFRNYGFWALFAAVVFTGYHSFGYCTLNYYVMSNAALLIVLLILFSRRKIRPFELVFAGFVFACCVLIEPVTALIYFLFCALVLIGFILSKRGKAFLPEYSFLIDRRVWLYLTAGILLCSVYFFIFMFAGVDMKAFGENFAQLVTDSEYNWSTGTAVVFKWHKIVIFLQYYGYVPAALNALYIAALLIFRKKIASHRALFFAAGCVVTAAGLVFALISPHEDRGLTALVGRPVIWAMFGTVCYILSENKNRRLFAFLMTGWFFAVFTDFISEVSVGGGCVVAAVPAVILFAEAFGEVKAQLPEKSKLGVRERRFVSVCLAVIVSVSVLCEAFNFTLVRTWHLVEDFYVGSSEPLDTKISSGPLKGIVTTSSISRMYDDAVSDLDLIRSKTDGPLYVADLCPWYYIYADRPIGVYTTFYVPVDSENRVCAYWRLHPDLLPQCIYVPYFNCDMYAADPEAEEKLGFFSSVCDYEMEEGKAGYILFVSGWHIPEETA